MERKELIDGILELVPSTPERQDRARSILENQPTAELETTHQALSSLAEKGREILARIPPEVRDAFEIRSSERLLAVKEAVVSLAELNRAVARRQKTRQPG